MVPVYSTANKYSFPFNLILLLLINVQFHVITVLAVNLNLLWNIYKAIKGCVYRPFLPPIDAKDKAVFVTGSASGFGFKAAQELDALGFTVFAGCRNTEDTRALNLREVCSNRLQLVKCDVTSDEDVQKTVHFIESNLGDKCLWALVSNAGIASPHPLDWGSSGTRAFDWQMNTNAIGSVRITKALLPLLRKKKGSRVILMSSLAAKISLPHLGSYSMSKAAMSSFGNSLRRHLKQWQISVCIIEPAGFSTPMIDPLRLTEEMAKYWEETPDAIKKDYTKKSTEDFFKSLSLANGLAQQDISPVIETITEAVTCPHEPEAYYEVATLWELSNVQFAKIALPEITDRFLSVEGFTRGVEMQNRAKKLLQMFR